MKRLLNVVGVVLGVCVLVGFTSAREAVAATKKANCSNVINMRSVPINSRGGQLIYKSNWNNRLGREQTFYEGNHSQKGAAFLVYYKNALQPRTFSIEVRDTKCDLIGTMGRFPRCTNLGCGEHERWYLKTAGGTRDTVASLANKARSKGGSNSVLIQLNGNKWAKVSSLYSSREIN